MVAISDSGREPRLQSLVRDPSDALITAPLHSVAPHPARRLGSKVTNRDLGSQSTRHARERRDPPGPRAWGGAERLGAPTEQAGNYHSHHPEPPARCLSDAPFLQLEDSVGTTSRISSRSPEWPRRIDEEKIRPIGIGTSHWAIRYSITAAVSCSVIPEPATLDRTPM